MADTTTLNQVSSKPREVRVGPQTPGLFNDGREQQDLEKEPGTTPIPNIFANAWEPLTSGVGSVAREATSAMAELINIARGAETPLVNTPSSGRIENFQTPHDENYVKSPELLETERMAEKRKMIYASLEEARTNARKFAHEEAFDAEVALDIAAMPEDERNKRLHLSLSLRKENTIGPYYWTELYRQKKEEARKLEAQTEDAPIPSPAKQPHALETQFEGGFGKVGSGTGSLSAASGAVG